MKKIVLFNPKLNVIGDNRVLPCLGLASMAAVLRKNHYACDVIDGMMLENYAVKEIVEILLSYDIIGISVNTPAFLEIVGIAEKIKKQKNIPIILGGHHVTFLHEHIIRNYDCFDVIIRGDGESTILELCNDYFFYGYFKKKISNVTYKSLLGKMVISNEIVHETKLDDLLFPVRDNLESYFQKSGGVISVSSSRGCPYGCIYCSATKFRKEWQGRTPENIAEEIYCIYRQKKDFIISFVDDNFYMDPERSIQIFYQIQKKCKKKFPFIFATRADQILSNGKAYLRELKQLGCIEIELGIENGSDNVLKRFKKNITALENKLAIQMIREQEIKAVVDYILFEPKITCEELGENIKFMKEAKIWGYDPPLIYERVVAFPGTEFTKMYPQLCNEKCYVSSEKYFENQETLEIYRYLQKFRVMYQGRINEALTKIRKMMTNGENSDKIKRDFIYFKIFPYFLFEKLVYNEMNRKEIYDSIIFANAISERLGKYE